MNLPTYVHGASLPRIGISSCLLGENVRYDGGNRKNSYITETLSAAFELIPFCPEVAAGMGIPRPPIQLVNRADQIHAVGIENPAMDMTIPLQEYASVIKEQLASLSGYVFKSKSPSCGITKVKVLSGDELSLTGQGIFARQIMNMFPALPLIDEQQLSDSHLCNQFLGNVTNYFNSVNQ